MTWQVAITLQIIVSALMTVYTRRVSLSNRRVFFAIGVGSYLTVALCGLVLSIVSNGGLPALPSPLAWLYILAEGLLIPSAWLIQYKLISQIGAGNAITVGTVNTISTALLAIILLNESISLSFIVGSVLILGGTLIALRIRPDIKHHLTLSSSWLLLLVTAGALTYAVGMYFEKMAITSIGVWNYSAYGWGMQFIGVAIIFLLFGRKEISLIRYSIIRNSIMLGFLTSIAGALFIYAVSLGSLSHTIIASSGKVAITLLLAVIFLHERNNLLLRITAFLLSITGLWLVIS